MSVPAQGQLAADRLLRHDYHRLLRQWNRIERMPAERRVRELERWQEAHASALTRFETRAATRYRVEYDPDLPISRYREPILELLQNRQVLVVCGETGSGKSTQLPKLCLEAGLGRYGWIGHTQPRRLAARSIAKRLADELDSSLGRAVGHKVRFQDTVSDETLVKLMTDGVLLTEIHRDPDLEAYDCVLIDEAHERSINIDLLMAYMARLIERRPELRLIITSATIDAQRFSDHFCDAIGPAPILTIEGRSYPVEIRYRGAQDRRSSLREASSNEQVIAPESDDSLLTRFCECVDELFREGRGDILAFFPTEREIRDATKRLRGHLTRMGQAERIDVLPLYARLTEAEQQRVFQPHSKPRIVLATNVAESSLTVPGIRYVIDTGTARVSRFAARSRVQRLPIEPICQASANQRSGRCGRLGPGIAIRMYDEADYLSRAAFAQPEIRRCDLTATILHAKSLGIDDIETLPWLDPPRSETVREGLHTLDEIGAIDERGALTAAGRDLARWPVSPRIGRMLLSADRNGCLNEMLIIAAALETQDPRIRPVENQQAADAAHQRFRDPNSDFLSYVRIWDFYQALREQLGRSRLERACRENFLSFVRLREWGDVHRQLSEQCQDAHMKIGPRKFADKDAIATSSSESRFPDGYEPLHLSILSGLLSGVAMLDDASKYRGASNMELQLWPGSGLRNTKAKWIVCAELVETTQRFARTVARIDPRWLESVGAHCIRYAYDSPHFSRNHGSAMVMRRGTLFGLPAVGRTAVPLAALDPVLARSLLVEHGLAEQQLVSRARFWQHNQKFLENLQQVGDRTRRRDCVVDSFKLLEFYRNCVPAEVVDRVTLEKWDRTLPREPSMPPFLTWEAIATDLDHDAIEREFPKQLSLGVSQLPLTYRFEPGDAADGVTLRLPDRLVDAVHREKLEWLVPGLLEEKLVALLKSLPKRLRRQLVPIPDTVRGMLPEMQDAEQRAEPFWKSLCQACSRRLGETVKPSDFDPSSISPHLAMRIEVIDEQGKSVTATRDVAELQLRVASQNASRAPASPPISVTSYPWFRESITAWDIEELPVAIVESIGGVRVQRFPTLAIRDKKICTTIVDHPELAEQMLREGWIRWWAQRERKEIRSQIAYLPAWSQARLWLSDRWTADAWTDWISHVMGRLAMVETDWARGPADFSPSIRRRLECEGLATGRVQRIALAAAELGRWHPKFSEAYQTVRKLRESFKTQADPSLEVIDRQLAELLDPSHAFHTPWIYVREIPRYLSAVATRLEKLRTFGSPKDLESDRAAIEASAEYARRWKERTDGWHSVGNDMRWYPTGKLLEYRWMIEEYRVSVHAQKLGTRVSVSPKRLEKLRDQIDGESK